MGTPKWSSYKSEHSAEIYANCSKGPVRLTTDHGTFMIGLMQVSLSDAGYGCVRPVRMTEESKFECDKKGRSGSQHSTSPDWRPYNDAAISLENLSKGPVEIKLPNGHGTFEPFKVGFMQLGTGGPGMGYTRPVRALNLHSKPDPMRNKPEQHQPRKQFEEKTEPPVDDKSPRERRRLVGTARMEAKDVDAMSPSELVLRRRRLAHGVRTPPVLAALMDEIEEAKRKYQLYYL